MTPEELASHIHDLLLAEIAQGHLSLDPADVPDTVKVERPRNRDHGDWASNIAMQLAKKAGMNPREFAQILVNGLNELDGIDSAEIAVLVLLIFVLLQLLRVSLPALSSRPVVISAAVSL